MRIAIIETGLPPHSIGGAEMQAWNVARGFQQRGHYVTVFCRRATGSLAYEEKDNIRIFRVKSFRRPFGIVSYILGVFFLIFRERKNCDVLLCFRAWPNGVIGLLVQGFMGIPSCFSVRGGDWYFVEPFWWGKIIYRLLFKSKMKVLVQTSKIRSEIVANYPEVKPLVIPNGIDFDQTYELRGESVMFVGNLIARKGVDVLIKAFEGISDAELFIVGDGPERAKLEALAASLNVTFFGKATPENIRPLMAKHGRIVVLPAVAGEGMPNVLLEAMSIGIPVVASDIAGIRDLLNNGNNGILVPPSEPQALQDAINRVMQDDSLWSQLSSAGKQAGKKYDWSAVVTQWEHVFTDMLCNQKKR